MPSKYVFIVHSSVPLDLGHLIELVPGHPSIGKKQTYYDSHHDLYATLYEKKSQKLYTKRNNLKEKLLLHSELFHKLLTFEEL